MDNKTEFIEQYKKLRELSGDKKPLRTEFLKFCKIGEHQLTKAFGKDAYSRLQQECGDSPNKLEMERASVERILNQYGELVRSKKEIPVSADWLEANYSPQPDGLRKVHNLKWTEMPAFFIKNNHDKVEWKDVIEILKPKSNVSIVSKSNKTFNNIVDKLVAWKPDRKRIIEEGYKIELRHYLEKYFDLEEETGESNPDLLLNKKYPIEVKRDPSQSEYDRLLGQMIRHNKLFGNAIAIVTNISSEDRFKKFQKLFIEVHDKLGMTAELLNK
ncbi:MAG TPA: hypothetical protein VNW99_05725 [Cytophagaceae bacterium]|jgi:hypothetical protein|nr:hypothetical protein [Cytophagaceae bacterium]